jgi:hypothetical protein
VSTFLVARKTDAVEVFRFTASTQFEYPGYPYATHDYSVWVEDAPPPPGAVLITKLAFRERFTTSEKITIELASIDVPDGQMPSRQASAQMRVWLSDIEAAQFIDLNYQPTRDGVQALEDYGLIGAGRALAILDAEPTAEERWNG